MTNCTVYVNCDTQDQPLGTSVVDWQEVDTVNDMIYITDGSTTVADGETLPSEAELNSAAALISTTEEVIPAKMFLADYSGNVLREIHNAGNVDKQYVFACDFDDATASEPTLEAWDDSDLDSFDDYCLGEGTANDSWYKAICTTTSSPGTDWTGVNLAGSNSVNICYLNDNSGALGVATTLYFNLKVVIPANPNRSAKENPVLCIKFTSN